MGDWPYSPRIVGGKLHLSADTVIAQNAWTPVPIDTQDFDSSTFTSVSGKLTCRVAGVYSIAGGLVWAASATGSIRGLLLRLNGTTTGYNGTALADMRMPPAGANDQGLTVATHHRLAVNDVLEIVGFQDSGGNLNAKSTTRTFLSMVLVGV